MYLRLYENLQQSGNQISSNHKFRSIYIQNQYYCEIRCCFSASMRGQRGIKKVFETRSSLCCAE